MLTSSREEALKRACVKLPGTESIPLSPGVVLCTERVYEEQKQSWIRLIR